ncbi:MAG: aldehyde dehydrogenase (NADP(+)) [Armatimonadota bacterium]
MSELQPVLIAGRWRDAVDPVSFFHAENPATGEALPESYPVSGPDDIEEALRSAAEAVETLRTIPVETLAVFLEDVATAFEGDRAELVALAHRETGYPVQPRLDAVELPRTCNQLRLAAQSVRERSWQNPTVDTAAGIRSRFEPLGGAVLVFGPNNFPFAFNAVSGGDFVAAIAAGCPVIAKAHASHPGTSRRLAEHVARAARNHGLPPGMVQMLYRMDHALTHRLIADPRVAAVGFTGSRSAGLAIKETADRSGKPVYLEMSSVNPVFVLEGALHERGAAIAGEFFTSCTMGAGQFCTNPGLIVVPAGLAGDQFVEACVESFANAAPGVLLGRSGLRSVGEAVDILRAAGAEVRVGGAPLPGPGYRYANTLLTVDAECFVQDPQRFQTEAFGPVALLVRADEGGMVDVVHHLEGNLTGTLYTATDGSDDALSDRISPILRTKVGRLLNDKMPTGVAVSPAMNHGGPYPATGHPHFTSVGLPAAIGRFARLASYDAVRPHRLPAELQDGNPLGIVRRVDGIWGVH